MLLSICDLCGKENEKVLKLQGSITFQGTEADIGITLSNLHTECGRRVESTIYRLRDKLTKEASEAEANGP